MKRAKASRRALTDLARWATDWYEADPTWAWSDPRRLVSHVIRMAEGATAHHRSATTALMQDRDRWKALASQVSGPDREVLARIAALDRVMHEVVDPVLPPPTDNVGRALHPLDRAEQVIRALASQRRQGMKPARAAMRDAAAPLTGDIRQPPDGS